MTVPQPLERQQFQAAELMADHPPIWSNRNKQIVFEIACPPGSTHTGLLDYSRWRAMPLPLHMNPAVSNERVLARSGYYDYAPVLEAPHVVEWYVNFADPHLFVAYGSSLFAQDEAQVAEHPALGALKEALTERGLTALTVELDEPTPVLVMGAERRCSVATGPTDVDGRPEGLYGNAFGRAEEDAIRRATSPIDPPTITNILAMAAPSGGYGRYTAREIELVLTTAYTGFQAAILESELNGAEPNAVVLHTGFWGCGAYGGNRVLMAMLQILAAEMAGLERVVFHTGSGSGAEDLEAARSQCAQVLLGEPRVETNRVIERIAALGFEWGISDGN